MAKIIKLETHGNIKGHLTVIEKVLPFEIKRVYYIFGTKKNVSRGFHAHHKIKQVIICVTGSCRFVVDDGFKREEVILDNPTKGLLIENFIWREMYDFSRDCVLLVLASEHYNKDDYIRDYQDFLKIIKQ